MDIVKTEIASTFPMLWYWNEDPGKKPEVYLFNNLLFKLFRGCDDPELTNDCRRFADDLKKDNFIAAFAYIQFLSQPVEFSPGRVLTDIFICNTGRYSNNICNDDIYKFPVGRQICDMEKCNKITEFDADRLITRFNIFFPFVKVRLERREDVEYLTSSNMISTICKNRKLYSELNVLTMHDYVLNATTGKLE